MRQETGNRNTRILGTGTHSFLGYSYIESLDPEESQSVLEDHDITASAILHSSSVLLMYCMYVQTSFILSAIMTRPLRCIDIPDSTKKGRKSLL